MMASAGEGNSNQHGEKTIHIEKANNVQVARVGVIVNHNLDPSGAPQINVTPREVETSLVEEDGPPVVQESVRTADKRTQTTDLNYRVFARGHRMGVTNRLDFCYHEGPDSLQIADSCTYIEVNINNELVQNIRSQGCLTAEVANGQSIVTLKWGSLEADREYIHCELRAELQPRLLDNYSCLEKDILGYFLHNSDGQFQLILKYFLKKYKASLLEIVKGCLVFKFLVPDIEAKDRLYSPDSLSSIAKFLDDLLVTDTIRERAGCRQVSFKVTALNDWSKAPPYAKHMLQFDTSITRESSPARTEDGWTHLIQRIVSQELRSGLSQIQVSLADTVARTVSMEMQKFRESGQKYPPPEPMPMSPSDPRSGSTSRGSSLGSKSAFRDHPSTGSESTSPGHPRTGTGSASTSVGHPIMGSARASPGHLSGGSGSTSPSGRPSDLSLGSGSTSTGHPSLGSGSTSPGHLGVGSGSTFTGRPAVESGSTSPGRPSLGSGSTFPSHLGVGSGSTSPGRPTLGSGSTSTSASPHGDTIRAVKREDGASFVQSRAVWIRNRDCFQRSHKNRSFASIFFDQQDRKQLWDNQTERAAVEQCFQLTEGSGDPLDDDTQRAVQGVREMVDVRRLAKLMSKAQTGGDRQLPHISGLHTILCLDVSESMKGEPFQKLIKCAKTFWADIEDNTVDISLEENVGVVLFGGDVKIQLMPTNEYSNLDDTITNVKIEGEESPILEGLIASILLLFGTDNDEDPYFTIGDHYCLNPRIILMSDGLTTEGGGTEGMETITDEVHDAVCKFLPMLLKASNDRCSINCVQFGSKGEKCISMMDNLSLETGGDAVDPTQIQWLSHYFRRQTAIGKVIDWGTKNADASNAEIDKTISLEITTNKIDDKREQDQVSDEVYRYILNARQEGTDIDNVNVACQSVTATGSDGQDLPIASQPALKPGDKVIKGPDWNYGPKSEDNGLEPAGTEPGTVIHFNQKDSIVKVKWANGIEDYYPYSDILLQERTDHQTKPSEASNVQGEDDDLQVDCDLSSDVDDDDLSLRESADDLSLRESDVSLGQHSNYSLPSRVETVSRVQLVKDSTHKIVWQRKLRGDNWVTYSPEQIDAIERSYTSYSQSCVVSSPDQQTKYHIDFTNLQSTNLSDNTSCEIRRSDLSDN